MYSRKEESVSGYQGYVEQKMRKAEKLINYISDKFPVLDHYEAQQRDRVIVMILTQMTDEKFDEIISANGDVIL